MEASTIVAGVVVAGAALVAVAHWARARLGDSPANDDRLRRLALGETGPVPEGPPAPWEADVERVGWKSAVNAWVDDLASDDPALVDKATDGLEAFGADSVPALVVAWQEDPDGPAAGEIEGVLERIARHEERALDTMKSGWGPAVVALHHRITTGEELAPEPTRDEDDVPDRDSDARWRADLAARGLPAALEGWIADLVKHGYEPAASDAAEAGLIHHPADAVPALARAWLAERDGTGVGVSRGIPIEKRIDEVLDSIVEAHGPGVVATLLSSSDPSLRALGERLTAHLAEDDEASS